MSFAELAQKAQSDEAALRARATEQLREAVALRRMRQKEVIAALDIPARALGCAMNRECKRTPAIEEMEKPASTILVLSGAPGTGKTVAAAFWLYRWVTNDRNWSDDEFNLRIAGRAAWISAHYLARIDRYRNDDLRCIHRATRLVLDDLGAEGGGDGFRPLLDELIDRRYGWGLPIVITTNLAVDEFRARYGERTLGRIRECGRFAGVGGESMRKNA